MKYHLEIIGPDSSRVLETESDTPFMSISVGDVFDMAWWKPEDEDYKMFLRVRQVSHILQGREATLNHKIMAFTEKAEDPWGSVA